MPKSGIHRAWPLPSAPIHRLPDEVLACIFHLSLCTDQNSNHPHLSPRFFTHVCKRWVRIALSNKSLWCDISMTFPLTSAQFVETNIRLMRSQPHPINVHLDFRDPLWDWDEETHQFGLAEMIPVVRLLLPHIARWRTLVMLTDTWAPIFCLLLATSCVAETATMLKTLSLSRCNAYFSRNGEAFKPESLQSPIKLFGGVPIEGLRHVSFVGVHVDWAGSHLANLDRLEFKYHAHNVMPSLDEFVRILDSCPRLSILSIIGWGPRLDVGATSKSHTGKSLRDLSPSSRGTNVISMEHLTRFALGLVDIDYAIKLLSLFNFPALRELELEDVATTLNPDEERDSSTILEFLGSESTAHNSHGIPLDQVTYLELRGLCGSRDAFVQFLSCTTALEHLTLSDTGDEAVFSLNPGTKPNSEGDDLQNTVCPDLRTLHCQNIDYGTLSEVLVARNGVIGRGLEVLRLEQDV
jgi:hypothetical protein